MAEQQDATHSEGTSAANKGRRRILTRTDLVEEVCRQMNERKDGVVIDVDSENVRDAKKIYIALKGLGLNAAIKTEKGVLTDEEVDVIHVDVVVDVFLKHYAKLGGYNLAAMKGLKNSMRQEMIPDYLCLPDYLFVELVQKWGWHYVNRNDREEMMTSMMENIDLSKLSYEFLTDVCTHRVFPTLPYWPKADSHVWKMKTQVCKISWEGVQDFLQKGFLTVNSGISCALCDKSSACYQIHAVGPRYSVKDGPSVNEGHSHKNSVVHYWIKILYLSSASQYVSLISAPSAKTYYGHVDGILRGTSSAQVELRILVDPYNNEAL